MFVKQANRTQTKVETKGPAPDAGAYMYSTQVQVTIFILVKERDSRLEDSGLFPTVPTSLRRGDCAGRFSSCGTRVESATWG